MEKKIVLPGEKIGDGMIRAHNTYFDGTATYAAVIGTINEEGRYIALETPYKPLVGDTVVGVVTDARHAGYSVDIRLPEEGFVPTRTIKVSLQLGDFVLCKIKSVNEVGDIDLGEVRRLPPGKIVSFPASKIPRLIGRKSSMIELLKEHSGGDIIVGNNGYVWISKGSDIPLMIETINMIKKKAHKSGLTDEISKFLQKVK